MLDQIEVASPCQASWDAMKGDARVRFCSLCSQNVYDLSGLTREAAERLVSGGDARVCVRFFRRADGTVLTADCPVGLAARVRRRVRVAAAGLVAFLGLGGAFAALGSRETAAQGIEEVWPRPAPPVGPVLMGKVCAPVTPPPGTPAPATPSPDEEGPSGG